MADFCLKIGICFLLILSYPCFVVPLYVFYQFVRVIYLYMSLLGNLIWIIFGGLFMSVAYFLLGIVYCITIIGIPVGLQLFKLASLSLCPFGREVRETPSATGCWSLGLNVLWILFGGLEMALTHVVIGLLFCVTIIGIPFGLQHFKLALLALVPFGKKVG